MRISSRTPEGDRNRCLVCGKETRTEPSETPTRDAPCPHCGHLLWFALAAYEEPKTLPGPSYKSYEGTLLRLGRERFGAIPANLVRPVLEGLIVLVGIRCVRGVDDIKVLVNTVGNWTELAIRLRRLAGLPTQLFWAYKTRDFVWRLVRRVTPRGLGRRVAELSNAADSR